MYTMRREKVAIDKLIETNSTFKIKIEFNTQWIVKFEQWIKIHQGE